MGREIHSQKDKRWARSQMGYVPQNQGKGQFPISVFEAVLLGRWVTSFAYMHRPTQEDKNLTLSMLETVGLAGQLHSDCRYLSGGQKQRLNTIKEADMKQNVSEKK
ncbi:hypothetical protein [Paenibacillus periandrae]|uniref:hypothetical protein n=1 Tax=Paenibacillus periandrae TaxID=1761741 RepID=UPI003B8306C3